MKWKHRISVLFFFIGWLLISSKAYAASGVVQFSTTSESVTKGKTFTVVCQVTSTEPFVDTSFSISYDDRYLTFLTGGKKVKGGFGTLQVSSIGNTEATYKKTFSLQFEAKKKGTSIIGMDGFAKVTDAEGNHFSMSSNNLTITVSKKRSTAVSETKDPSLPHVTPEPVRSKENRLKALSAHCLSFSPQFSPEQTEYDVSVDADTDTLYVSFVPMDEKARVLLKGNEKLQAGANQVVVRVIAENGQERQYKLLVMKENREEMKGRQEEEESEKTLQSDTASMTEQGDGKGTDESQRIVPISNYVLLVVIVILVILLFCVLILLLKKAMKKKTKEG